MTDVALPRLEGRERAEAQIRETRVTAKIVRTEDGERRTIYRANGRSFGSLDALAVGIGVVA